MGEDLRTFPTSDGLIHYEVIARQTRDDAAPALVLLHNFMSSGRAAWGPLLEEFSQHFRLILPDLPGHGRSLGYPAGFHHLRIATQLAALLAAENADNAHLAGCSSGGMLAQLLVMEGLMQPASLTLISTTYSVNPIATGNHRSLDPADFQAGARWLEATARLHDPYRYPGYFAQELLPGFQALTPQTAIDLDVKRYAALALPICLIHGAEDEFFPILLPERIAANAPRARLHIIAGQSHALLFRRPWQVGNLMVEFWADLLTAGAAPAQPSV
jgi:pimeloyl-ACP methyl ester carboxylesterase